MTTQAHFELLQALYHTPRSLLGKGFEDSLQKIRQYVDLEILTLPSGTRCGSWVVPQEWIHHHSEIRTLNGKTLLSHRTSPHALWHYSTPFKGILDTPTLKNHLVCAPLPNAAPLLVTYYKERWGMGVSQDFLATLTEPKYEIEIETEFKPGQLSIGYAYLPGTSKKTILLDAVLSCGPLANNLTGVMALTALYTYLKQKSSRHYNYRFLFTPETLGPIAIAHHFSSLLENIAGGMNLQNLADPNTKLHFKESRIGDSIVDRAFKHVLMQSNLSYTVESYDVRTGHCGNEKAYNSLGIESPISAFRRSQLGTYPEYDTSLDDLRFIKSERLQESFTILKTVFDVIEQNRTYQHTFKGEPFLSGYGLFPKIENDSDRLPYDYLMGFSNGKEDLLSLADRAKLPLTTFIEPALLMKEKGLLRCIEENE